MHRQDRLLPKSISGPTTAIILQQRLVEAFAAYPSLRRAIEAHVSTIRRCLEAQLFIDPMRVTARHAPMRHGAEFGMVDECPHQPQADALPAALRPDDDVGEIGEHRAVGDRPAETDLSAIDVGGGAERIGKGSAMKRIAASSSQ